MLEMEHHLRPHCDQLMQDVTSEGKRAREKGEKSSRRSNVLELMAAAAIYWVPPGLILKTGPSWRPVSLVCQYVSLTGAPLRLKTNGSSLSP